MTQIWTLPPKKAKTVNMHAPPAHSWAPMKAGHGLDQARSGLGPAVFFCYTHIFSLFFPGLLRYRSRSRCSRIALSLPGLLVFRLALSGPPSLSASHVAAPALLLSHTHRSICTFLYILCFPTSSPAGRRPCSPSASRHLGTPTRQSYLFYQYKLFQTTLSL